jgi:hypothetical protein
MRFRVHLYVLVRVEHELEAETPEEAALQAFAADLDLHSRFRGPDQEYAEDIDDICLVDPLTDEVDADGRRLPDFDWSQWLRVTEVRQADDSFQMVVTPAPLESTARP